MYDFISEDHLLLSHIRLIQFPWDRCLSAAQLNKGSLDEFDFLYIHSTRSSRSILSHKLRLNGLDIWILEMHKEFSKVSPGTLFSI